MDLKTIIETSKTCIYKNICKEYFSSKNNSSKLEGNILSFQACSRMQSCHYAGCAANKDCDGESVFIISILTDFPIIVTVLLLEVYRADISTNMSKYL